MPTTMPLPQSPLALPDGSALLHNLLDRAIIIGASGLEFMASGEVVGQVDGFKGRLDAQAQEGKFALYGAGIRSLAPDSTSFTFRYEGDHESCRGEYSLRITSYEPEKLNLSGLRCG